jgi:hypothetical protein
LAHDVLLTVAQETKQMRNQKEKLILGSDLRTLAGLALTFASLLAFLALVGCAPKPVERQYPVGKTDFGPIQKDPPLKLDQVRSAANASSLKFNETISSARYFRFGENLIALGKIKESAPLVKLGSHFGVAFYSAKGAATHTDFVDALYLTAASGETREDVFPVLNQNDQMLANQLPIIRGILEKSAATFPWPAPTVSPKGSLELAKDYVRALLASLEASKMNRDVFDGVKTAINTDFFTLVNGLEGEVDSIMAETDAVVMIDRLKATAKKYAFTLDDQTTAMIDQARTVFVQIGQIQKNQDALTVIVELWELTDESKRQSTFEPVSKDLYNFLKGKGPGGLGCLKSSHCLNPLIFIPKEIAILPAIEKYGLLKLQADLGKAAHDALVSQISAAVAAFVPTLPKQLDTKVTEQIQKLRDKIASVESNYSGFLKGIAREYVKQDLKQVDPVRLFGAESNKVSLSIAPGALEVSAATSQNASSGAQTGAEVLGDSMAYAASLWKLGTLTPTAYSKSVVSQVDKMLAIAGFKTPAGKMFRSLAVTVNPDEDFKHFSVRDDIGGKSPFAVPDSFPIATDLTPTFTDAPKNFSVRSQAELLRGLAAMTRYFRDWEKNGFDATLGKVQVGHLIKDLPASSITSGLFPKDSFFALGVANGATILTNMTKKLSPVFLIDITKKTTWANDRTDDADQPATMAGLVDIVNGKRGNVVHLNDAAHYLLAVADFLEATNGIEKTQASPLITPSKDTGKRPVDQLIEARSSLSMLIVGIANFISHELADKDGGLRASFRQDLVQTDKQEPRRAADQAIAILALSRAGQVLDKTIYDATALDAYAFLNSKMFNPKTGFYNAAEDSTQLPAPDEMVTILLAGEALRARMSDTSRSQWDMLSAPWLKALEGLN